MIDSAKGKPKINIDQFLYIKDKNRDDFYYWMCEYKGQKEMLCTPRATKIFIGGQHKIREFRSNQHLHVPQANQLQVPKTRSQMKELAQIRNDQPAQFITNVMATMLCEIHVQPCLPQKDALRQQIKRTERVCDEEVEPKALDDFKLPDACCPILSRQPFAKTITDRSERILIFTAPESLKWLQEAKHWIVNGTFKTELTLF